MQEKFAQHVSHYPIQVEFPATVSSASDDTPLRTDKELIQHRLIEAGILFDAPQSIGDLTDITTDFVSLMNKSGCFNAVQVMFDSQDDGKERLNVVLNERKWYRLYIGGGLKHESLDTFGEASLPKVQFETSGGLLNLSGHLDTTSVQYAVDQTSASTLSFIHERPLYSMLTKGSPAYDALLSSSNGSQISIAFRAMLDTLDHEWTRSYKEYQRLLSVRVTNPANISFPEAVSTVCVVMKIYTLSCILIPSCFYRLKEDMQVLTGRSCFVI